MLGTIISAARTKIQAFVDGVFLTCTTKFNFPSEDFIITPGEDGVTTIELTQIVTHEYNTLGNRLEFEDPVFGLLTDIGPLVVCDNEGEVVRAVGETVFL